LVVGLQIGLDLLDLCVGSLDESFIFGPADPARLKLGVFGLCFFGEFLRAPL
jgi:hypothetical protein